MGIMDKFLMEQMEERKKEIEGGATEEISKYARDKIDELLHGKLATNRECMRDELPVYNIIVDGEISKTSVQINEEQEELRYIYKGRFTPIECDGYLYKKIDFDGNGLGEGIPDINGKHDGGNYND